MEKLYFNADTGVLSICEDNQKGQLIRSNIVANEEEVLGGLMLNGLSHMNKYIGSEFYVNVQNYLAG